MLNKRILFIAVLVLAASCACNALYQMKYVTRFCDTRVQTRGLSGRKWYVENVTTHGSFIKIELFACPLLDRPEMCKLYETILYRPDLGEKEGMTRVFATLRVLNCEDSQEKDTFYPYVINHDVYLERTPSSFHGKDCFYYVNKSNYGIMSAYASESGDEVYCLTEETAFDSETRTITQEPISVTREFFTLDPVLFAHSTCDKVAFTPPSQEAFDKACQKTKY